MYDINGMIDKAYNELKINYKYKDCNNSKLEFLSRLGVYEYLRYKVANKTKVMNFNEYCDYKRLEMSILISNLNHKRKRRDLKNGYDHLYNEMEPLFKSLSIDEANNISKACLDFAGDIYNFDKLEKYLKYEPIKTYIRFVTNRYKIIMDHYNLDNKYKNKCELILDIVGHKKKCAGMNNKI